MKNKFDLQRVWDVELDILEKIDEYCKSNSLKYSLAYGTLLGAVRNKGFIPWDDDVDIIMPRYDYEYLINNWNVPGYVVQNKITNSDFNQNFTKIRKDHSTFIQFEFEKSTTYHKGIFVDIFPVDRVAPTKLKRLLQYIYCAFNLLYTRDGVASRKQTFVERILLMIPNKWRLFIIDWTDNKIQKWNSYDSECFVHATLDGSRYSFASDLFSEMIYIEFAGKMFMSVRDYDDFLKRRYGDYMTLPPESERVYKHHPLLIDINKNYDETDYS